MSAEGSLTAVTDINIVNSALSRLGQTTISAFGQNVGTGLITQAGYNMSRDALLRKVPWNFAKAWASLDMLSMAPMNLDIIPVAAGPGVIQYTNAYQLPLDFIRLYRFSPKDAHYRIVGNTILSDAAPGMVTVPLLGLQPIGSNGGDNQPFSTTNPTGPLMVGIEYIRRIQDPNLFDPTFVETFVWKLCVELSFGVTGIAQLMQQADTKYKECLIDASSISGQESWPDPFWNSDLNDVRYGYVGVTIEGY
jgi:hypothetical protein